MLTILCVWEGGVYQNRIKTQVQPIYFTSRNETFVKYVD